jgi:hypothetical protein
MKMIRRITPGGHTFYEVQNAEGYTVTTGSLEWLNQLYPELDAPEAPKAKGAYHRGGFEAFETEVYSIEPGDIVWISGVGRIVVSDILWNPLLDRYQISANGGPKYGFQREDMVLMVGNVENETTYAEPRAE